MQHERNYVISIAGFDPSAGAGILADIKTFEQLGVCGLGVCSAITVQTENQFKSVRWIPFDEIIAQLQLILEHYPVQFMKIGIVESMKVLEDILHFIHKDFPHIKIIWDPILKATSGFEFHHSINQSLFLNCCSRIFLITPNAYEAMQLMNEKDAFAASKRIQLIASVFLKSYVREDGGMNDVLFYEGTEIDFKADVLNGFEKHGSGCVLSAAITAFLALGNDLKTSCELARTYTYEFLRSTQSLLGEHRAIKLTNQHA